MSKEKHIRVKYERYDPKLIACLSAVVIYTFINLVHRFIIFLETVPFGTIGDSFMFFMNLAGFCASIALVIALFDNGHLKETVEKTMTVIE